MEPRRIIAAGRPRCETRSGNGPELNERGSSVCTLEDSRCYRPFDPGNRVLRIRDRHSTTRAHSSCARGHVLAFGTDNCHRAAKPFRGRPEVRGDAWPPMSRQYPAARSRARASRPARSASPRRRWSGWRRPRPATASPRRWASSPRTWASVARDHVDLVHPDGVHRGGVLLPEPRRSRLRHELHVGDACDRAPQRVDGRLEQHGRRPGDHAEPRPDRGACTRSICSASTARRTASGGRWPSASSSSWA